MEFAVIENDEQLIKAEQKITAFDKRMKEMSFSSAIELYSQVQYHDDLRVAVRRYKRSKAAQCSSAATE
jgi:hypothetical protein